jgi:2'-hydroxyisoflavone reductase
MKLLLLGGTMFLGRHLAAAALHGGHEVTLFHRGQTGADLFPEAEHILGDRMGPLDALAGRSWDVVVDTSAYFPDMVKASAGLLGKSIGQYIFVSTISVYSDVSHPGLTESAPRTELTPTQLEEAYELRRQGVARGSALGHLYGGLKTACEVETERAMGDRGLIIRPGLIVGPHDYSDRFTYWVRRLDRGGEVLSPGSPERRIQFIDARDLAEWMLRMAESSAFGVYQATGPETPIAMGEFLGACSKASGNPARLHWVSEDFLAAEKVGPWMEMPLWVPDTPDSRGFMEMDCSKAIQAGLTFRPVLEIVRDTLDWDRGRPQDEVMKAGMTAEREAELLARYASSSG